MQGVVNAAIAYTCTCLSLCVRVCVNATKAQVKSELSLVGGCTETETDLMIILFLHWN